MGPKLARLYPGPAPARDAPPIFTRRTLSFPAGALVLAALAWVAGLDALATALVAVFTVYAMQLAAPWVRRQSHAREGLPAELLFAAPFVLFFLPYVAWALAEQPPLRWSSAGVALAIAAGAAFQLVVWKQWSAGFAREIVELLPPLRLSTGALQTYQTLASAITQELFYRGALFVLLVPWAGWWVVPLTTILFVVEHMGTRWASATHGAAYYARIAGLSLVLAGIAYETGSLYAAILGHCAFNLAPTLQMGYRFKINRYQRSAVDAG